MNVWLLERVRNGWQMRFEVLLSLVFFRDLGSVRRWRSDAQSDIYLDKRCGRWYNPKVLIGGTCTLDSSPASVLPMPFRRPCVSHDLWSLSTPNLHDPPALFLYIWFFGYSWDGVTCMSIFGQEMNVFVIRLESETDERWWFIFLIFRNFVDLVIPWDGVMYMSIFGQKINVKS